MKNASDFLTDPRCDTKKRDYKFSLRDFAKQCPQHTMETYSVLRDMDEITRKNLANFLKTDEFDVNAVNGDNVFQYLELARSIKYQRLECVCEEMLLQNIYPQGAVNMFLQGTVYHLDRVRSKALRLIEIHIGSLWNLEEIQHIGPNDLFDLLKSSNIKEGPFAMKIVNHWFSYEKEPREDYHKKMVEYIQQVQVRCRPLEKIDVKSLRYQIMFRKVSMNHCSKGLVVHMYEPSANYQDCLQLKEFKNIGKNYAVCCLQNSVKDAPHLYVSGGDSTPNVVYHYDVLLNSCKKCSKKLNFGRASHCMEAVGSSIYVLGGSHHGQNVSAIEEFNHKRHSWKIVGQLRRPVHSATCAVLSGDIYVFGGIMDNGNPSDMIQKFSPKTGECHEVEKLPFSSANLKAVAHSNSIYVIADDGRMVSFAPGKCRLKTHTSFPVPCRDCAVFSERDGLYVAGGTRGEDQRLNHIYRYANKSWQQTEKGLTNGLSVQDQCTIYIPQSFQIVPFS